MSVRHSIKVGDKFGRLLVVEYAGPIKGRSFWRCRCDCGTTTTTRADQLKSGHAKSCGCLALDGRSARATRHGMAHATEYTVWEGMKARCLNPSNQSYKNYGGRGVAICREWADSFEAFLADMGPRPSPKHTIDRIDNDKGYGPGNCRWATSKEQARNRRKTVWVEFGGEMVKLADLAERHGIGVSVVYLRLRRGWEIGRAITAPVLPHTDGRRKRPA